MRTLSTILLITCNLSLAFSQYYGNEWINYNQTYFKFPVVQTGIYKIDYQTLINAGVPVSSIPANKFQIFGKEKEIPLFVRDGGDNTLNMGDYIEFYAERNDGWLDSLLYDNPKDIGNPNYSLYNDTLYYFLTWTTGSANRYINETDTLFSNYNTTPYVFEKSIVSYQSQYYGGYSANSSYSSFFSPGEGWGGPNYNGGTSGHTQTIPVPTTNIYTGSDAPPFTFQAKSNANSDAVYSTGGNHHLRWEIGSNNLIIHDEIFIGYRQTVVDTMLPLSILSEGITSVFFKIINDLGALTDYQSISYLSIRYPKTTTSSSNFITWDIPNAVGQAKNRIDLTNPSLINPSAYVLGGGVARKIPFINNNGTWSGLIPNGTGTQRLIISSENQIKPVTQLTLVNGTGKFTNYQNLNLESAYIILYNKVMKNSVTNYSNYRKSVAGGSHNVILCEIGDLWMQYGGGVPKHILGISRAAKQIYNMSISKPKALFIIGKGITESSDPNTSAGSTPRKNSNTNTLNLVPSYGNPSSDLCITAKWDNSSSYTPAIPTGRLAAKNNMEVELYLNKIIIYEQAQNQSSVYNKETKEWQKQILHFGGGSNATEQNLLKSYLESMKHTIEGANYGGNVTSFYKSTTDPFNPVQSTIVNNYLEDGISLMTFFGHAHAEGFDQNVDNPSDWNNTGKYPMVIGNGCYTGDIYKNDSQSTAEVFVLTEDMGAIGFLSKTKLGYTAYLNRYSSELYRQISQVNYGASIGEQMINTINHLEQTFNNFLTEVTATQFILHGDPALKLNWHAKPEIDLTYSDVFFTPSQVDYSTDSITANIVLTNLGRSILDTFSLTVSRSFPNTTIDSVYHLSIPGLHYRDTVQLKMPLQPSISSGINQFTIQADIPSFIPEQYEEYTNNEVKVIYFVNINGIVPVWPHNYAVVPEDSVVLKASTINPVAAFNTYRFEIDTTDLYNSPFKRYAIVQGLGGVKEVFPSEWKKESNNMYAPLILEDSVSYFWRVSIDSNVYDWKEYSFQYIKNKRGWGQAHFFQFKNGGFNSVDYDRSIRKRKFEPQQIEVSAQVYDNASSDYQYSGTLWKLNGQEGEYGICTTNPGLYVAVINPLTMEPWGTFHGGVNADYQFGNANDGSGCRNRIEKYFIFWQNSATSLQNFKNMVENEVPEGHILLIYTSFRARYSQWNNLLPELFTTFQNLGATGIDPSAPERAFIFMVKKGDLTTAQTTHAQTVGEMIFQNTKFTTAHESGVETSTIIGPSLNWKTLYWKQNSLENPSNDSTRLIIRGLNANKQIQLEIDTVFTHLDSILNLNNLVPAAQYPFLQLQAKYYDKTTLTPAQIERWHVLYDDVPEAAIDGTNGFVFLPQSVDSLQEGVEMSFAIDVKNISDLPMDSILIHYWLTDKNQIRHNIPYSRQDSLRVSQTIRDTIRFSSLGLSGDNVLWMEVNPYVKGLNNEFKDQPELAHFNNLLQIPFFLKTDDINPILDVTFDGEHILNGDIISPTTEIIISLKDENPFLVMNQDADTTNFGIYLTNPSGVQKRISFMNGDGNYNLQWIPADESNLRFKIIYNANFEEDGIYELLVQGADKAGNLSGNFEYRIRFEVILESSITHLMNYPNPFSTSTRFVFTLTGTKVPEDMIIQIMTVTGRIVREITEEELGFIRIGRNITEYAWDGRDEFGDPLANGVYLYRVKARIDGDEIKHRSSGADKYFKKSWGKMYLMR